MSSRYFHKQASVLLDALLEQNPSLAEDIEKLSSNENSALAFNIICALMGIPPKEYVGFSSQIDINNDYDLPAWNFDSEEDIDYSCSYLGHGAISADEGCRLFLENLSLSIWEVYCRKKHTENLEQIWDYKTSKDSSTEMRVIDYVDSRDDFDFFVDRRIFGHTTFHPTHVAGSPFRLQKGLAIRMERTIDRHSDVAIRWNNRMYRFFAKETLSVGTLIELNPFGCRVSVPVKSHEE